MLAGVLLHVIEASFPGDRPGDLRPCAWQRRLQHVCDAVALVDDIGHSRATQRAEIVRLPARRRIERRLVQVHPPPVLRDVDDACIETRQVRIRVVQPCCAHSARSRTVINMSRLPSDYFPPFATWRSLGCCLSPRPSFSSCLSSDRTNGVPLAERPAARWRKATIPTGETARGKRSPLAVDSVAVRPRAMAAIAS